MTIINAPWWHIKQYFISQATMYYKRISRRMFATCAQYKLIYFQTTTNLGPKFVLQSHQVKGYHNFHRGYFGILGYVSSYKMKGEYWDSSREWHFSSTTGITFHYFFLQEWGLCQCTSHWHHLSFQNYKVINLVLCYVLWLPLVHVTTANMLCYFQ